MAKKYLPRIVDSFVDDYLEAFGSILIKGPKWCGKTTTAETKAKSVLKMQDSRRQQDYLKLADTEPAILLQGETPRLIDEWQMAPVLWDAVRAEVDERGEPGQFILTGSSVPKDGVTKHTGTGRIGSLVMRPMTLFESNESNGKIRLGELFDGEAEINGVKSELTITDCAFAICRGGWPSSVGKSERSALLIAREYAEAICETDAAKIDGVTKNPERLKALMRSYARNVSTLATNRTVLEDIRANDSQISETTLYSYLDALKRLFVIEEVPAWSPSIRSKTAIRSSNKKEFVDPSIAVSALGLSPKQLLKDFNTFGFLFEAMCIRDLRVYSQSLDGRIFYYSDNYGLEVDAVIRLSDGRYALVEIKLGSSEIDRGAANLLKLKSLIAEKGLEEPGFLMVLTGGAMAYTREDGVSVIPLGCLKN